MTPTSDGFSPHVKPGDGHAFPAALVAGDRKTPQQETLDGVRAAGIAMLTAAAMVLTILTGMVTLLAG